MASMEITRASASDAEEILALQKLAYESEAEIYGDFQIAPLTQTIAEIREDFKKQVFLKAVADRTLVGSVRGYEKGGTAFVGRLVVHPEFQNRGLGTALMWRIEAEFKSAMRFELFTGHRSEKNIRFYHRLGYSIFKEQKVNDSLTMVFMEKLPL
jgi:ribosomal protein S18 acetylase RimI-like enzyme